jgi:hypothetical protein
MASEQPLRHPQHGRLATAHLATDPKPVFGLDVFGGHAQHFAHGFLPV